MNSNLAYLVTKVNVIRSEDDMFSDENLWLYIENSFSLPRKSLTMQKIFSLLKGALNLMETDYTESTNETQLPEEVVKAIDILCRVNEYHSSALVLRKWLNTPIAQ